MIYDIANVSNMHLPEVENHYALGIIIAVAYSI